MTEVWSVWSKNLHCWKRLTVTILTWPSWTTTLKRRLEFSNKPWRRCQAVHSGFPCPGFTNVQNVIYPTSFFLSYPLLPLLSCWFSYFSLNAAHNSTIFASGEIPWTSHTPDSFPPEILLVWIFQFIGSSKWRRGKEASTFFKITSLLAGQIWEEKNMVSSSFRLQRSQTLLVEILLQLGYLNDSFDDNWSVFFTSGSFGGVDTWPLQFLAGAAHWNSHMLVTLFLLLCELISLLPARGPLLSNFYIPLHFFHV